LSWSVPLEIDSVQALNGVSCASKSLCVAVDQAGQALVSADPAAYSSWASPKTIDPGHVLTSVSCAPNSSLCVAGDDEGRLLVSADSGGHWEPLEVDGTNAIGSVSCASTSLCVAVDESGNVLVSGTPGVPAKSSWSVRAIDPDALRAVSCAPGLPCVAVDDAGRALVSSDPAAGAWSTRQIDGSALLAVSCAAAPAGVCVAVDEDDNVLVSGDPGASNATWSTTPIEAEPLTGVSCSATGLCVLIGRGGNAYTGDDPTSPSSSWRFESIDSPSQLSGVSCISEGLCVAVDRVGHALATVLPAPIVATTAPSVLDVAETAAQLSGAVDTNDVTLTSCRFEYGTSEAYGRSVPCGAGGTLTIVAGSEYQPVGAFLSGLTPNVTYDYRLVAVSASGEARTANTTFKTPAPPLVQPHPSIGGIPAVGQRLTCKPGVGGTGAATATLGYAWLRDTKAIAGADGSTYVVGGGDVSHHLQCRVTATNAGGSASATSAFVTVPAGGLGAISETQVGTPRVAGRTVGVPLTCSAQAAGSCTITVRLTVLETLHGGRVVAVTAQRARARDAAAGRRVSSSHRTVLLGSVTAHVPAGQRRTVAVALNATGRSLLARVHRLSARLSVSGTVVGAIGAQLRTATVTFTGGGGPSHKASVRRAR
jgi:hypothetical protein